MQPKSVQRHTELPAPPRSQDGAEIASLRQELIGAYEQLARMEADLHECLDYFKDHYDVVDGDYGEPSPNKEMQLGNMIQETLHGPGAF